MTKVKGDKLRGVYSILGWKRSGWLHIFFRPIRTFIIPADCVVFNLLFSCQIISSYRYFCLLLMPHRTIDSVFLGSCVSTSFFSLRKKNGRSTVCNFFRISWLMGKFFYKASWNGRLNHSLKSSKELKTFGIKKCRRDQSSLKSFWSGVPVSNKRCRVLKLRRICHLWDLKFFIFWASSSTM